MYRAARLFLAISVWEFAFCLLVVAVVWWPWPLLILAAIAVLRRMERGKSLWAHGTAKWADEVELREKGMIGGNRGLSIGRLSNPGVLPWKPDFHCLFDSQRGNQEACERFGTTMFQGVLRKKIGETVRLARAVHTIAFAPTGVGKGTSLIVPWLLETDESALVLDFKGELAAITAKHRQQMFRHRCVLLDPFHVVTTQPDCFNPIDFIEEGSSNAIDDCRDLATQLVVRAEDERDPHWSDSAEAWISAALAATVLNTDRGNRSLQTVRTILSNPDNTPKLIEFLCEQGDLFARLGSQLAYYREKELASTLTSANRHLRFLDTPAVAASTVSSSFDPRELRNGKMTVFCILPPQHMRSQAALIRLWVGSLMRAVIQGGLQHG